LLSLLATLGLVALSSAGLQSCSFPTKEREQP
jgi:hypothetical protein